MVWMFWRREEMKGEERRRKKKGRKRKTPFSLQETEPRPLQFRSLVTTLSYRIHETQK